MRPCGRMQRVRKRGVCLLEQEVTMDHWTLVAEYLAFVILVILFLRYYLY